jgi:UPF0176 protein
MLNLAFYKFVSITDTKATQRFLSGLCSKFELFGTLLLAKEGVNGCLVGKAENALAFVDAMHKDDRFFDIYFKKSESETTPFRKLIVKIKNEIVTMGVPGIEPEHYTADHLPSQTLQSWLDEGQDIVMLDTRNDYEVKIGTFEGALDPNLRTFRSFPKWVDENRSKLEGKKVVAFCTGGIRCEKATAYMRQVGLENVYQLDGGILKYFEETQTTSNNHWQGDCFVFDYRVAVNKDLKPSFYKVCFACRTPLTPAEVASEDFKEGLQCPHCLGVSAAKQEQNLKLQKSNNLRAHEQKQLRKKTEGAAKKAVNQTEAASK